MNPATFSALSEPSRLHIIELLVQQPLTVGEIATRLQIRQPQASKHLRVLSDAGLIEVEAQANRRVCTLRLEPFQELDTWLDRYRQLWEGRYDRLDSFLEQLQEKRKHTGQNTPQDPAKDPEPSPQHPKEN